MRVNKLKISKMFQVIIMDFDLEYSMPGNDGEYKIFIYNYVLNNFTDFQLVGILCTFECLNRPDYYIFLIACYF